MPTIDLAEVCQIVQQDLIDVAAENAPMLKQERTGFLDAVISAENRAGVQMLETDTNDGKYRQVKLEYIKPGTYDETSDSETSICAAGTEEQVFHDLVKVTRYRRTPLLDFTKEQLRKFCDAPSVHRAKVVNSKMSALFRAINRDLLALYGAGYGNFIGGVTGPKDINLIRSKAGQISADYTGEILLNEDMEDLAVDGEPFVIGTGALSQYARLQEIGCCNDLGQDLSKINGWRFYRDRDIDPVLGPPAANKNIVAAFAPGAVQMVEHNKNKGEFAINTELVQETTIINPMKNIELDMDFKYDECTKTFKMVFGKWFDLWMIPADSFKATDERNGVNYSFLYNANTVVEA